MKKSMLILAVLIGFSVNVISQTPYTIISGHVTNLSAVPIPNHVVGIIADSSGGFSYTSTATTDINGFYVDTVPGTSLFLPLNFYIYTADCNSYSYLTATTTGAPIVADFSICDSINPIACQASFMPWLDTLIGGQYSYSFYDYSYPAGGNIIAWQWSFGDGTGSNLQNPTHLFGSGTWTVCLTIATDLGCSSSYCYTINDSGLNNSCWSYFTYQQSGTTFAFQANTGNAFPTQYTWDFGDGAILGPGAYSNATHNYATNGYYTVCLVTTDSTGCSYTSCQYVYAGNSLLCSANFYLIPDSITPHLYYAVNMAYGTPPLTYVWSWGDGTSSTGAFPSHTYANAGFYTICLTITDSTGCTSTFCDSSYIQKSTNTMVTINVVAPTTSISELNPDNSFKVYPNPAQHSITIDNLSADASIDIFDMSGRNVLAVHGTKTINISNLTNGIYCVRISGKSGIAVKRFIKE